MPFEVLEVHSLEVRCDGAGRKGNPGQNNPGLGHPRVFLHIDQEKGEITCPYCSRQYVLRIPGGKLASGH